MTHDESPTARALLVLELIQNRPGVTADRLGEPDWYARQLTAIEAPFRIVKPNELRDAARELGRCLKQASDYR
jgi:hypothetical protein